LVKGIKGSKATT